MDQSLLVANGHRLLERLDAEGMRPVAALWFHDLGIDAWRLWIVPGHGLTDRREFYRRISETLNASPSIDLSTGDVQFTAEDHPAIMALGKAYRIEGRSTMSVSSNMLNGFFIPDGIVLRMAIDTRSRAA